MKKKFISAQELLELSTTLAIQIFESGYRPNFIVGIWRGGAPVGICIQEILEAFGLKTDHIAIRTSSYQGIGQQSAQIKVHGLGYIEKKVNAEDKLLIIDDVYDTGRSIEQVLQELSMACRKNMPEVKIATPFYKPTNNQTKRSPNFYLHETNQWLVFPHEVQDLTAQEIQQHRPELAAYTAWIQSASQQDKTKETV